MTNKRPLGAASVDRRHGTDAAYRRGCRCERCRIFHRNRRKEQREDRPPIIEVHGRASSYTAGCRCPQCLGAMRAVLRRGEVAKAKWRELHAPTGNVEPIRMDRLA